MEDVLRSLGFLCLGSRMKRIGEQLQADTQRVLDRLDTRIQSSQYPLLAALDRLGPVPVGELARSLGIAQPGVTRSVALLAELGLVEVNPSQDDQRRRIVSLSRNGRRLVDQAKREIWPSIENAVGDLCADLSGPLLGQLAAIEDRLAATPLHRRVENAKLAAS
ncbi:MarR family winged helix-turn-helix transcriptional regulator [Mesorhizobium sp. CA7]|uniref:MarR family winged helix-turn-helix transcriptional regulator n=1 Tax=Mesorhizobium sp. CA7 TaxID=588501 RepID=UPI001CCAD5D0|nr:MarR family transcriptional regulator [Mesorhizobium sp. CA7]MBZ9817801.1 MarR family transcriptional regulator [Mesorhizobium sp. CA7]